jgi:hypothetical protein
LQSTTSLHLEWHQRWTMQLSCEDRLFDATHDMCFFFFSPWPGDIYSTQGGNRDFLRICFPYNLL